MTTIAYKDGIIAYDSRQTRGDVIISDNVEKMELMNGVRFFLTGSVCDFDRFMSLWFDENANYKNIDCCGLVVCDDDVYRVGVCEDSGLYKSKINSIPDALGSGNNFALTAMDMGATAAEAVRQAMKRDVSTGGVIRTYKLSTDAPS